MNALSVSEIKSLKIGDRVTFPNGADAYPDFFFSDRLDGTISEIADDCVWVKLDVHKPELDEWRNQIQIWFWPDVPSQLIALA